MNLARIVSVDDVIQMERGEVSHRANQAFYEMGDGREFVDVDGIHAISKNFAKTNNLNAVAHELKIQMEGKPLGIYSWGKEDSFQLFAVSDGIYALGLSALDFVPIKICSDECGIDVGLQSLKQRLYDSTGIYASIRLVNPSVGDASA